MRWPFVKRSTYEALLKDFYRHEDAYWKQFSHNGVWESKYNQAQKELEKIKGSIK